jgi:hypothetical protein
MRILNPVLRIRIREAGELRVRIRQILPEHNVAIKNSTGTGYVVKKG